MNNVSEYIEDFLKALGLDEIEWPLGFSILISIWMVE